MEKKLKYYYFKTSLTKEYNNLAESADKDQTRFDANQCEDVILTVVCDLLITKEANFAS